MAGRKAQAIHQGFIPMPEAVAAVGGVAKPSYVRTLISRGVVDGIAPGTAGNPGRVWLVDAASLRAWAARRRPRTAARAEPAGPVVDAGLVVRLVDASERLEQKLADELNTTRRELEMARSELNTTRSELEMKRGETVGEIEARVRAEAAVAHAGLVEQLRAENALLKAQLEQIETMARFRPAVVQHDG